MKLITKFELAARNKNELYGLYSKVFNELANTEQGSIERTNALTSLENIQYEISLRTSSL